MFKKLAFEWKEIGSKEIQNSACANSRRGFRSVLFFLQMFFLAYLLALSPISLVAGEMDRKYTFSVCALFKNEEKYLKEWIEYHKMIGVDHFYLYDNGSKDRSSHVLAPYIREGLVTLIPWPDRCSEQESEIPSLWVLSTQLTAYENAAKYAALKQTKWLAFIDVDEYLVPVHTNTITEVVERYEEYAGLRLTSDFFDASHIDVLPKRELLIATVELTDAPEKNIQKTVEKMIFKPELHTTVSWPPFNCNFKDNRVAPKLSQGEVRINKYVNRHKGSLYFGKRKERLHVDSRMLTESEKRELLEIGFEIEDKEKAIYRFETELKKRMGVQAGWNW
jgi:hypothetical protein